MKKSLVSARIKPFRCHLHHIVSIFDALAWFPAFSGRLSGEDLNYKDDKQNQAPGEAWNTSEMIHLVTSVKNESSYTRSLRSLQVVSQSLFAISAHVGYIVSHAVSGPISPINSLRLPSIGETLRMAEELLVKILSMVAMAA